MARAGADVDEYIWMIANAMRAIESNRIYTSQQIALRLRRPLVQVQTVSISYLRCLIEHVRCYILDRDIELIYYTIRKSSDVLTRDPMQLGAQVN